MLTRSPYVAGQFYPEDKEELKSMISETLGNTKTKPSKENIKALIVPHAGYVYSAPIAAYSYQSISEKKYNNVFLIGNSHSQYFEGIAVDDSDKWETPLGFVDVNKEIAKKLTKDNERVFLNQEIHAHDHALEVQLPFLQTVIKNNFKIVPIVFGNANENDYLILADVLKKNVGENDLIVISSDMSHYPSYEDANRIDKETLKIIETKDIAKLEQHILENEHIVPNEETLLCGIDGVKTVMKLANELSWKAEILKYANSGDSEFGDKERVVGYGATIFFKN